VRKESEKLAADPVRSGQVALVAVPDVRACFVVDDVSARYEVSCSEGEGGARGVVGSASKGSDGRVAGGSGSGGSVVKSDAEKQSEEVKSGSSGNIWTALWGVNSDSKAKETLSGTVGKSGEIGTLEDLERTRLSYEKFIQAKH